MSTTPIFDATLTSHPEELWLTAPKLFPWPKHYNRCRFDGYNWHVCTCPHVRRQLAKYDLTHVLCEP